MLHRLADGKSGGSTFDAKGCPGKLRAGNEKSVSDRKGVNVRKPRSRIDTERGKLLAKG